MIIVINLSNKSTKITIIIIPRIFLTVSAPAPQNFILKIEMGVIIVVAKIYEKPTKVYIYKIALVTKYVCIIV